MIDNTNKFKAIKNELTYISLLNLIQKRKYVYPSDKFCSVLAKLYQNHSDTEYYIPFILEHDTSKRSGVLILRALQNLGLVRTWISVHIRQGIEQQAVPTEAGFQFLDDFLGKPKKRKPKDSHPIKRAMMIGSIAIAIIGVCLMAGLELFDFDVGSKFTIDEANNFDMLFSCVIAVTVISLVVCTIITHSLNPKQTSSDLMTKELTDRAIFSVREDKMLLYLINNGTIQHQISHINQKTLSVINQMLFDL